MSIFNDVCLVSTGYTSTSEGLQQVSAVESSEPNLVVVLTPD